MKNLCVCVAAIILVGCSVFGKSSVEIASYHVLQSDNQQKIELRHYERLVLVSTPMVGGMDSGKNDAFYRLFGYISGKNTQRSEITMTAPVFLDGANENTGVKIPMTAPVFMEDTIAQPTMSFVLPTSYTLDTAPAPQDPKIELSEEIDYTVAVITFNGMLARENIDKHTTLLQTWIEREGYKIVGIYKAAGYNPPFTIPSLRRNEVLIPVAAP